MDLSAFTNVFSRTYTLRNSLVPLGKTMENLEALGENNPLVVDKQFNEDLKAIKNIIDNFHRSFISQVLETQAVNLKWEQLIELWLKQRQPSEASAAEQQQSKNELKLAFDAFRQEFLKLFTGFQLKVEDQTFNFKQIFKKELFTEILPAQNLTEREKELLSKFQKSISTLTALQENRKNLYTDDQNCKSSVIVRMLDDNLPRFGVNYEKYLKISEKHEKLIKQIDVFTEASSCAMFSPHNYHNLLNQENIDVYNNFVKKFNSLAKINAQGNKLPSLDLLHSMPLFQAAVPTFPVLENKKLCNSFKLFFGVTNLAGGWSESKEQDFLSVIFKKDQNYFLGIMNAKKKVDFSKLETTTGDEPYYLKMKYTLFSDFAKMLPKCSVSRKNVKEHFNQSDSDFELFNDKFVSPLIITQEIFELNNSSDRADKKFTTAYLKNTGDEVGFRQALNAWINFGKDFLAKYKTTSGFDYSSLRAADDYANLEEFYRDIDNISYRIEFAKIPVSVIDDLVDSGKLYLFQIYNKDFSTEHKGNDNLHTIYLKNLFSKKNSDSGIMQLNGNASLLYREKAFDKSKTAVHQRDSALVNKTYFDGETYRNIPNKIYVELYRFANGRIDKSELSDETRLWLPMLQTKASKWDVVKDKHYTEDRFLINFPITINYRAKATTPSAFNKKVQNFINENEDVNVMSIDLGFKDLISVVILNQKGQLLYRRVFNTLPSAKGEVDFYEKIIDIKKKFKEEKDRRFFKTGEGFLSTVINEIAKLIVKYRAVVMLDNLNYHIKRETVIGGRRFGLTFAQKLSNKLNYLVFKSKSDFEAGGLLNGYQLTAPINSFSEMGAQNGFLFFIDMRDCLLPPEDPKSKLNADTKQRALTLKESIKRQDEADIAYRMALKGLLLVNRIRSLEDGQKLKTAISNLECRQFFANFPKHLKEVKRAEINL